MPAPVPEMRVLLVSYYFPPYNTVGAVRPGKWAKFLHRRGHTVHVVSAQEPPFVQGMPLEIPPEQVHEARGWSVNAPVDWLLGGRQKVAREGYMGPGRRRPWLQRLGSWYKTLLHWPDAEIGWVGNATQVGRQLLATHEFDLIYVSAPSFSALRVGRKLSRSSSLPWVAEFRDLWSDNHSYAYPAWRRHLERLWEKRLLRTASALVTISAPFVEKLQRLGKPVWEIRNGFDPEDLVDAPVQGTKADVLNIVYTGSVYPDHHDLTTFCAGLAAFRQAGGKANVHVVGRNVAPLLERAREWKVDDWMTLEATVERRKALSLQCSADVLLLFLWSEGSAGIYTTKLFEYAGAHRPILAVGSGRCDVSAWVREAGIGEVATDAARVAESLRLWQQRKLEEGGLSAIPKPGYDFTRDSQFAKLESGLQALLDSERASK